MNNFNKLTFFPIIALKVTKKCNMNCKFCCETNSKNITLTEDKCDEIINLLAKNNVKRICISGGEPLLFPHLEKLLINAHNNNIETILLSADGKLLNEFNIDNKYIDKLRISIHGIKEKHDDITRTKGSFENIKMCLKKINERYNLSVTFVITNENKDELNNTIEFFIKNNIKTLYIANLLKSGNGKKYIESNGKLSNSEFNKIILEVIKLYGKKINIITHSFEKDASCIVLYPDGSLYIEPYKKGKDENYQKNIGNIFKENPKEIFKRFKSDEYLWRNFCSRLKKSTIYKK